MDSIPPTIELGCSCQAGADVLPASQKNKLKTGNATKEQLRTEIALVFSFWGFGLIMSYNTHVIPSAFRCITSKILSVRLFCALDTSLVLLRVILQDFLFDIFLWWKRALILCDQYLTIIYFVIGYNLPVCRLCGFQQSSRVLVYHFRAISHPPR